MPLRFNRYAKGLLGFLDAKTQGQQPTTLADELRGTVDVTRFLEWSQPDHLSNIITLVTGSGFYSASLPTVPEDERWLLLRYSIAAQATLATAGDTCLFAPVIRRQGSPFPSSSFDGTGPLQFIQALQRPYAYSDLLPVVMLPGDELGAFVVRAIVGGAAVNLQALAVVQRFTV